MVSTIANMEQHDSIRRRLPSNAHTEVMGHVTEPGGARGG